MEQPVSERTEYDHSARQAATFLGFHVGTVKRWAREGKLRGVRTPGGQWRFRQIDLEAALADAEAVS